MTHLLFQQYLLRIRPLDCGLALRVLSLCMLLLGSMVLTACGGSSPSESSSIDPPAPPITSPLTVPGAYMASLNNKEWIGILQRTTGGSGAVTQFWGLHYNATDPDLFSGSGLIAGTSSATLNRVFYFANIGGGVRTGTGTVINLGNGVIRTTLSFPASGTDQSKEINVAASQPSTYAYNVPASLSRIQGTWQGRWSYGLGFVDNFNLNISGQGELTATQAFQQDCNLTQGAISPNFDGTNLFTVSITIPNATQCSLKSQTLNGAAFVTNSPVAGKTQRLYIVGVTTDGRGISFKADR